MSTNFKVRVKDNNGDLHLSPRGDFDGSSAWELVNLLQEKYDGKGQIIIDTRNLLDICPFGCSTFQYRLRMSRIPADCLWFKGEKGPDIAPRGSKIILNSKGHNCRCTGDCVNCSCKVNSRN